MKATIRLFKAVPIKAHLIKDAIEKEVTSYSSSLLNETIQNGFIISPEVMSCYGSAGIKKIVSDITEEFGLSGSQMNASFHKSWGKIKDTPIFQLVLEQIRHYFTTYGHDVLGIYDKDTVYIPKEELNVPGLDIDVPLVIIKGLTHDELLDKLGKMLSSGIALKEETLADVINVAVYLDIGEGFISGVNNKEARVALYDHLDKLPHDPVEFLRFIVYKATGKTLLIKNGKAIGSIKGVTFTKQSRWAGGGVKAYPDVLKADAGNIQIVKYFKKYDEEHGLKKLSTVFNRFKPLFLAFKTNDALRNYINTISKLSKKHHQPMNEDYLNSVTSKLCKGIPIDPVELRAYLKRASIFRKARLAYALKFRMGSPESIMYRIRNGTAYAKEFSFPNPDAVSSVLDIVIDSIVNGMNAVKGKKFYIPKDIVYALPCTEKQFTGDVPSGSFVSVDRDLIAGVHWKNAEHSRIDLDLSMTSVDAKIGWDGFYRSDDANILFSGDMTDAPDEGASEMFYVMKNANGNYVLAINYFNHNDKVPVSFTVFVGRVHLQMLPRDYIIDPNSIICKARTRMDKKQKIIGLIAIRDNSVRFHFCETQIGESRTMSRSDYMMHALGYLVSFYSNPITLNDLIVKAGAIVVDKKDDLGNDGIDLSPDAISKETFLNILS